MLINPAIGKVDLTDYLSQYKFDSLVISEIILKINKKFNLVIKLNILFKNPTLRALAKDIIMNNLKILFKKIEDIDTSNMPSIIPIKPLLEDNELEPINNKSNKYGILLAKTEVDIREIF